MFPPLQISWFKLFLRYIVAFCVCAKYFSTTKPRKFFIFLDFSFLSYAARISKAVLIRFWLFHLNLFNMAENLVKTFCKFVNLVNEMKIVLASKFHQRTWEVCQKLIDTNSLKLIVGCQLWDQHGENFKLTTNELKI